MSKRDLLHASREIGAELRKLVTRIERGDTGCMVRYNNLLAEHTAIYKLAKAA